MLRVKDKSSTENTYGFETPSKCACKHLWKCCVEHHAFFRLTQSAGNTPQAIFSLGSKFRYSGRTEKEVQQDAKLNGRPRVEFSRSPSRRQSKDVQANSGDDSPAKTEIRTIVSLPSSVSPCSQQVFRSTSLPLSPRSVSPHSRRSAAFHPADRLYSASSNDNTRDVGHSRPPSRSHSPRSAKSSSASRYNGDSLPHRRTSSVESQSSIDSRSCHHRQGRGRCKLSDGDSEVSSKCSSKMHRRRKHRRRHRLHSNDSTDQKHHHRTHRHRSAEKTGALIESSMQWAKVQAGETPTKGNQATVRNLASGYSPVKSSFGDGDSCKRHRNHRSTSPADSKKRIPAEIRRHIDFDLQTPIGLSESQLKEIPYTEVSTAVKNRHSRSPNRKKSPRKKHNGNEYKYEKGNIEHLQSQYNEKCENIGITENSLITNGNVKRQAGMPLTEVSNNGEHVYQNEQIWKNCRPPKVNTLPKRSPILPLSCSSPHFDQHGIINNITWTKPPLNSQDSQQGRHNGYCTSQTESPESGIDQCYRNIASSNQSGYKQYNEEMIPGFADSYNSNYLKQNPLHANSQEQSHCILKPQPSPQSSVTSGISVCSSSTTPLNESVDGDHTEANLKDKYGHFVHHLYPNSMPNIHMPKSYSYHGPSQGINEHRQINGRQIEKLPIAFSKSYPMMDSTTLNSRNVCDQNTVSHVIIKESGKNARYISYVNSESLKSPLYYNSDAKQLKHAEKLPFINNKYGMNDHIARPPYSKTYSNHFTNGDQTHHNYYPKDKFQQTVKHQKDPAISFDKYPPPDTPLCLSYPNYNDASNNFSSLTTPVGKPYQTKIDI